MGLNSLKVFLLLGVLGMGTVSANDEINENYLTVGSVEVNEIHQDVLNQEVSEQVYEKVLASRLQGLPNEKGMVSTQGVGEVIAIARGIVALGEEIYALVDKGRPVMKTSYAPISVLPTEGGKAVSALETENWKMPSKRTYEITYKNLYGMEVVKYRYSVIFSYGGSYKGKGAYITGAQIVPVSISVSWGYSFSATMRLASLQNYGTVANPIAGVTMSMEYTVETIMKASLETDSYHVTGQGAFKAL